MAKTHVGPLAPSQGPLVAASGGKRKIIEPSLRLQTRTLHVLRQAVETHEVPIVPVEDLRRQDSCPGTLPKVYSRQQVRVQQLRRRQIPSYLRSGRRPCDKRIPALACDRRHDFIHKLHVNVANTADAITQMLNSRFISKDITGHISRHVGVFLQAVNYCAFLKSRNRAN